MSVFHSYQNDLKFSDRQKAYTVCHCVWNFWTPYAPVICNHYPPNKTGNSGDNFSSITALLKALHCGDLLRVIALLFIIVNSMGVYLRNITRPALTRHCGELKRSLPCSLAPLSPAHPRRWEGREGRERGRQWLQMTGALEYGKTHTFSFYDNYSNFSCFRIRYLGILRNIGN